jgi:hypothetical protein
MKKTVATIIVWCFLLTGCESLRFAPGEAQKQNAWLHSRTAAIAADAARDEETSGKLQGLTELAELQSRALISYYGLPKEFPSAGSAEDILSQSNFALARTAWREASDRPDAFAAADNIFELAIGISALLGGVYGTRAARFLKDARAKSKALKEVVEGNELFKKTNAEYSCAFKAAHKIQSPQTRQIVAKMRS